MVDFLKKLLPEIVLLYNHALTILAGLKPSIASQHSENQPNHHGHSHLPDPPAALTGAGPGTVRIHRPAARPKRESVNRAN